MLISNESDLEIEQIRRYFQTEAPEERIADAFDDYAGKAVGMDERLSGESLRRYNKLAAKLGLPLKEEPVAGPAKKKPLNRRIVWRVAAVAIPFIAIMGTGYFVGWFGGGEEAPGTKGPVAQAMPQVTVETVDGVHKDEWLPDSTRVWVNSGSRVVFSRNEKGERIAELEGEAYFDVRHEKENTPFIVHTAHLDVRVLGTKFDVKAYPGADFTEVALYEGSVEVISGNNIQRLVPDQRLTYRHATNQMTVAQMDAEVAAQQTEEWRSDIIFADEKSVGEILRMIGNAYNYEVELDDASLSGLRYSISFNRTEPVEYVLRALADVSGNGFGYELKNDTIKIYKK